MGCSGSKHGVPAALPPPAVAPAGVLKPSKYGGTVTGAAAAIPARQDQKVSFKAAIQKQLAVQAFEHAGEAYRCGQVSQHSEHHELSVR